MPSAIAFKSLPLPLELKALSEDDGPGTFAGYGSTFGGVDMVADTIQRGAYAETIPQFIQRGFLADNHRWSEQIGIITLAREDEHGLWIEGEFHPTPEAQAMRARVRHRLMAGKFVGLSIGADILDYETRTVDTPVKVPWGYSDEIRVITRMHLYEVSIASVPIDTRAELVGAKSGQPFADEAMAARDVVRGFVVRARSLADLRAGEGRPLSETAKGQIEALLNEMAQIDPLRAELADLVATTKATEPTEPVAIDGHRLLMEFERTRALLSAGV